MNKWQKIAARGYGIGEYAEMKKAEEAEHAGDTLFLFIMRELASSEGCNSQPEALRRMKNARDDIQNLIDNLS